MKGILNMRGEKGPWRTAVIVAQRERKLDWKGKKLKLTEWFMNLINLEKDLYNGKGFGIELMKIEKTKQTTKDDF